MAEKLVIVHITSDERTRFLNGNQAPKGDDQAYIWFAVENCGGYAFLFPNELPIAAEMARNAGIENLAQRIENAVRETEE